MAAQGQNFPVRSDATFQSRFSTLRWAKAVSKMFPLQLSFVSEPFKHLLNVREHVIVPMDLLEWLAKHMRYGQVGIFEHGDKVMTITRDMVDMVFGWRSGSVPFCLESSDINVVEQVMLLKKKYNADGMIKLATLETVMLSQNTEADKEDFIRSFMLYFLSLVACPTSYNFVNHKYMYSLLDVCTLHNLDLSTFVLEQVCKEIDSYKDKVRAGKKDPKKSTYIGGCLPLLAIIYLDSLDLNFGKPRHYVHDDRLPRILFVRKHHFEHVKKVDMDRNTSDGFGILPIPTPTQSAQLPQEIAAAVIVNNNNEIKYVKPNVISISPDSNASNNQRNVQQNVIVISPDSSNLRTIKKSNSPVAMEDQGNVQQSVIVITPDSSSLRTIKKSNSPVAMEDQGNVRQSVIVITPDSSNFRTNKNRNSPVAIEGGSTAATDTIGTFHALQSALNDAALGLNIAMSFANDTPISGNLAQENVPFVHQEPPLQENEPIQASEHVSGPSTIERKNRKKRAAKVLSPVQAAKRIKLRVEADHFYTKYPRKKIFKEKTLFVDIAGSNVFYGSFYNSFKARGDVAPEVMNALIHIVNDEAKNTMLTKPFINKYTFSPFFTDKLLVNPDTFDPKSLEDEFSIIESQEQLWKKDLMHFPFVANNHWVLICINSLYENTNFFDPSDTVKEENKNALISNLVSNFSKLCKHTEHSMKDIEKFKSKSPGNYPAQSPLNNSAYFVVLYTKNWDGKTMKPFDGAIVPKYRMILSHKLFSSTRNQLKEDTILSN